MPARFIVVPQWQGSSSSRSMRLIDGAEAIRGDLPSSVTTTVEVPLGAGEALGTDVARFSSLSAVRERLALALGAVPSGDVPVVIGGDCGIELAAVEHALRARPDTAVVWFDAHADLHLPSDSPSGAFHGMVARALLGHGAEGLVADPALPAGRLVLAGVRACEPEEDAFITSAGVPLLGATELEDPAALVTAVEATGATSVYVHVDLDVLDPDEVVGVAAPEPFGIGVAALGAAIRALRERFELVGAGITEFAPASPADARTDLPAVLRVLSALTARAA